MNELTYALRYMRVDDIPRVVEIDKLSFPTPWSPRSYLFEINDNTTSHMITLETQPEELAVVGLRGMLRWRRFSRPVQTSTIVGYSGVWLIDGEGHISTIAIHPDSRGKKLGEALLNGMLRRCMALNAAYCVLEVRVGNEPAQALYQKYGFENVGRRRNYYRDNNEDAFLMHAGPFDDAFRARLDSLTETLRPYVSIIDRLAETQPRRLVSTGGRTQ